MPAILFVCTGNLCRSPLAAGLLRARVAAHDGWVVDAAGIAAHAGLPSPPHTLTTARELGVDLHGARSRAVVATDFARYPNIVAMDRGHLDYLRAVCPADYHGHIDLLHDAAGNALEIPDPYGRSLRAYRAVAARLVIGIEALYVELTMGGGGRWVSTPPAAGQRAR